MLLYEIYDDDAAFEAHMRSAHFVQFDAESAPLIVDKSVIRCDLVCEGGRRGGRMRLSRTQPQSRAGTRWEE